MKEIEKMYETFSFLILQMDCAYMYKLQKFFFGNSYCLIMRNKLQNIFGRY